MMVDLTPARSIKRVHIPNDRELQREFDGIQRTLSDNKGDWKQRMNALQQLQGIVLGCSENSNFVPRDFAQQAVRIREPLVAQVQDLRSAIVREACSVLFLLSHVLGYEFEPFALQALPVLFKATFVAIAVIAESSFQCICAIVRECRTQRVLGVLVEQHSSRNGTLRWRCTQALLLALQTCSVQTVEKHIDAVEAVVKRALEDARDDVRACGRQCFWVFQDMFEERAAKLYARLDANKQKVLDDERHGRVPDDAGVVSASPKYPTLRSESPSRAHPAATASMQLDAKLMRESEGSSQMLQTPPHRGTRQATSPHSSGARLPSRRSAAPRSGEAASTPASSARGNSASVSRREASSTSRNPRSSSKTDRNPVRTVGAKPQASSSQPRPTPTRIPTPALAVSASFPHRKASSPTGTGADSTQCSVEGSSTADARALVDDDASSSLSGAGGQKESQEAWPVAAPTFSPPPRSRPTGEGQLPDDTTQSAESEVPCGISPKPSVADLLGSCGLSPQRSTLRALALSARTEAASAWERHFGRALLIVLDSLGRAEPQGIREAALLCLQELVMHQPSFFVEFAEVVAAKLFELCQAVPKDKRVISAADRTLERLLGIVDATRSLEILLPVMSTSRPPLLQVAMRILPIVLQRLPLEGVEALLNTVLPGVIAAFGDQSAEVRKAAVFCIVDIYFIVSDEVMTILSKELSPSQLKLVMIYISRQQRERDELASVTNDC